MSLHPLYPRARFTPYVSTTSTLSITVSIPKGPCPHFAGIITLISLYTHCKFAPLVYPHSIFNSPTTTQCISNSKPRDKLSSLSLIKHSVSASKNQNKASNKTFLLLRPDRPINDLNPRSRIWGKQIRACLQYERPRPVILSPSHSTDLRLRRQNNPLFCITQKAREPWRPSAAISALPRGLAELSQPHLSPRVTTLSPQCVLCIVNFGISQNKGREMFPTSSSSSWFLSLLFSFSTNIRKRRNWYGM